MKFRHRIAVISAAGDLVGHFGAAYVVPLLDAGRAIVSDHKRVNIPGGHEKIVAAVTLQAVPHDLTLADLEVRDGSLGIERVHSHYGIYFQHHRMWAELLERAA